MRVWIAAQPIYQIDPQAVMNLVLFAWSGLGVVFGPIVILSLYAKNINRFGVMAGLVCAGLTAIFWPLHHTISIMVVGYCVNFITTWLISTIVSNKALKQ